MNTYLYVGGKPIVGVDLSGENGGTLLGGELGSIFGPVGTAIGAVVGTVIIYIAGEAILAEIDESNTKSIVSLYRVVDDYELGSLEATNMFSMSPYGFREKQFWFMLNDATWFAENTLNWSLTNSLTIIHIRVEQNTVSKGYPFLDAGHQAVSFNDASLPSVNNDFPQYGGISIIKRYGD